MAVGDVFARFAWTRGVTLAVLSTALSTTACREQKSVTTTQLGDAMAENAYQPFTLKDGCELAADYSGHCTTEHVLESSVTSSNGAVFEVLAIDAGPAELGLSEPGWLLHSRSAGAAKLDMRAKFDDGTERKATQELTVRRATRVKISSSCDDEASGVITLAVGQRDVLEVALFAGEQALAGIALTALKGDGIKFEPSPSAASTRFTWEPTTPGEVALTSDVVDKLPTRLRAVAESEISVESLAPVGTAPFALTVGQTAIARMTQSVNGAPLCQNTTVVVRTESPDVCDGPDGELEWEDGDLGSVAFTPRVAGTCRLSAGTSSGKRRTFDIPCVAR